MAILSDASSCFMSLSLPSKDEFGMTIKIEKLIEDVKGMGGFSIWERCMFSLVKGWTPNCPNCSVVCFLELQMAPNNSETHPVAGDDIEIYDKHPVDGRNLANQLI